MNLSDVTKTAPKYLNDRSGSLRSYVQEVLFPDRVRDLILRRASKGEKKRTITEIASVVEEATLLAYVFVTHRTFIEGSKAAKNAVDTFEELGVPGFYLGTTYFSRRNEAVILGDKLAEQMLAELDDTAREIILRSEKLYQVLEPYRDYLRQTYGKDLF
jgi:hypothetical protein